MATETEGPHGLNISPDGRFLFMTTGHGVPDGKLWKFHAGPDTLVGDPILLGYFPATLDLTPDGLYAFVANFNLHGEMVPSTISVVYTPDMVEVEQVETCTMPHGARLDAAGVYLYSACMMDDQIVRDRHANLRSVAALLGGGGGGGGARRRARYRHSRRPRRCRGRPPVPQLLAHLGRARARRWIALRRLQPRRPHP